ncbi:MAG: hypothetical protein V4623_06925 [Pseudomonadota bacterium]
MKRPARPQLTWMILFYGLFDILGMLLLATGGTWLINGNVLFLERFPSTTLEAIASSVLGVVIMLWAAAQVLRELLKRDQTEKQ